MNNKVTFEQTIKRHQENNIDYKVLDLGDNFNIVLSSYGGRVYGPFDGGSESILWMHKAFSSEALFAKCLEDHYFHVGGERLWIGPELDFFCKSPELFDDTYTIQKELDPGNFSLSNTKFKGVKMEQEVELRILKDNSKKSFYFSRSFSNAPYPLKFLQQLNDIDVRYCGFTQNIHLKDTKPEKQMFLDPWILTQINPGGRIIVPYFGELEFDDYYDPVDDSVHCILSEYAELDANGHRKYKVAYKSANTFGRMGYVNRLTDDNYYLMIRNYYNDPSIPYCSEPWKNLGERGTSMYFYNDDGSNGGFAEFENSCTLIGSDSNKEESYSTSSLWFFIGSRGDLQKIIKVLLGIKYSIEF